MEQMDLINLPPPEPTEKKKEAPQLAVSGAELADWLCVSPAAITQGRNAGFFVVREDGRYDLKASVQSYIHRVRGKKVKTGEAGDLKKQLDYWDVENKKTKNRDWRMRYGQEIAMAIIGQLTDIFVNAKNTIAKSPETLAFFDNAIRTLGSVDLDMVLMQTEDVEENEITGGDTE